jgi:hypothetical protein
VALLYKKLRSVRYYQRQWDDDEKKETGIKRAYGSA